MICNSTQYDIDEQLELLLETSNYCSLIVWNDEVNTFDWVIETLMDICKHSEEQAEQSALIIHSHGKYAVKKGDFENLKKMCDCITDRGINATVEIISEK